MAAIALDVNLLILQVIAVVPEIVADSVFPVVQFHFATTITAKSIIVIVIRIIFTAETVRNLIYLNDTANRNQRVSNRDVRQHLRL